MRTDRRPRSAGEEGFTLIEVLVAMLILSVGLLGLEALGIGVARSLATAETKNEMVAVATAAMEQGQQSIRADPDGFLASVGCEVEEDGGFYVCTDLSTAAMGSAQVTVSVAKNESSEPAYTISSYVFDPDLPNVP